MRKNLFIQILDALSVKYTPEYATAFYEENPNKDNLYGLSKMLNAYGVETLGLEVKRAIPELLKFEPPLIAYYDEQFVLVREASEREVTADWFGQTRTFPAERFLARWSGVVLLMEATDEAIEPNYRAHLRERREGRVVIALAAIALAFLLGYGLIRETDRPLANYLFFLINLVGAFISALLVQKDLSGASPYADKICSLFLKSSDCGSALSSSASRLFGISWSCFGLGYFLVNVGVILFAPSSLLNVILFNFLALPYTLWSVWYQKFRLRAWCSLCLIVQATLWISALAFVFLFDFRGASFDWAAWIATGCLYGLSILALQKTVDLLARSAEYRQTRYKFQCLKANEAVFTTLLAGRPRYALNKRIGLQLGNPEADKWLTIVSNPHCGPCARLHERLKRFLEAHAANFRVQILLTSFGEELEASAQLLVAQYLADDEAAFLAFLDQWYREGKDRRLAYYEKYHLDTSDARTLAEWKAQKDWVETAGITRTPTLLLNGHLLPEHYALEDLAYFTDTQIA